LFIAAAFLRLAAALALCASASFGYVAWPVLIVLCATTVYYSWYRQVGGDGSEQMGLIVLLVLSVATGPLQSDASTNAALYFVAAQCLLAYFAAGVAKLTSRTWRSGVAVARITNTEGYGLPHFQSLVGSYPSVGRLLTWSSIVFEVALPPAVLVWSGAAAVLIVVATAFHCACAIVMGLNGFPLSFAATYPALLFSSQQYHRTGA
jgi:hypothetical protein